MFSRGAVILLRCLRRLRTTDVLVWYDAPYSLAGTAFLQALRTFVVSPL